MKTEQEMTKDKIKKALTCCSNPGISYCKDCPYANNGEFDCCNGKMYKDVLNLITEQEKEIERLQDKCEELRNEKWDAQDDLDCYCDEIPDKIKQAQIDILNKANERLNVVSREFGDDCDLCGVSAVCSCRCEINNLIKEVQND